MTGDGVVYVGRHNCKSVRGFRYVLSVEIYCVC